MKPYYESGGVTIYHGDARDVLPTLDTVDLILTDPPYSARAHKNARGHWKADGQERAIVDDAFASMTRNQIKDILSIQIPRRWLISFMDYTMVPAMEVDPPRGIKTIRMGIWIKPNGAPQFTGDRLGMGWEAIWFAHNTETKLRWSGKGRHGVFHCPIEQGEHPTMKPLKLVSQLIELFSEPKETILDPFMGVGTMLLAAKNWGRKAIGIEINERYAEIAAKRLGQEVFDFDGGEA